MIISLGELEACTYLDRQIRLSMFENFYEYMSYTQINTSKFFKYLMYAN